MIENYRSELLWDLFMSSPEIAPALDALGFVADTRFEPAPNTPTVLEDFEGGTADLAWQAFDGTYNGPVLNTDRSAINASEWVGSYQKGEGAAFSFFRARLPEPLDLSTNNQVSIQVNASAPTRLLLKLEGGGQAIERSVNIATAGVWRTYTFDFIDAACYTGLTDIILFFDPGEVGSSDNYLFDNIVVSPAGPCSGTDMDPTVIDDFECQRNGNYTIGSEFLSVISNPDGGTDSDNRSSRVGAFDDQPGAYNALVADFGEPIDLTTNNQFSITIWAPVTGNILFKLEGESADGQPLTPVEFSRTITATESWQTYAVDLSALDGVGYTRLVFFFGAGTDNATVNTYFVDDLRLTRPVYLNDCVIDLETAARTPVSGTYFANGSLDNAGLVVVENPVRDGNNASDQVALFQEAADGTQPFAGLGLALTNPVTLSAGAKTATLDVWMPRAATVVLKLEQGDRVPAATGDVAAAYTTPGAWQKLTFDLSAAVDGARYERITLILNSTEIPAGDQTYYFDNLAVGSGTCGSGAVRSAFGTGGAQSEVVTDGPLRTYPNPIGSELTIESPAGVAHLTLVSMLGQTVRELKVENTQAPIRWGLTSLEGGTYLLIARDDAGRVVGRSVVIKQ